MTNKCNNCGQELHPLDRDALELMSNISGNPKVTGTFCNQKCLSEYQKKNNTSIIEK